MTTLKDYSGHGKNTGAFKDIVRQANLAIELEAELSDLKASLPKIKADAFKDGVERARDVIDDVHERIEWGYDGDFGAFNAIDSGLDKLEAGE